MFAAFSIEELRRSIECVTFPQIYRLTMDADRKRLEWDWLAFFSTAGRQWAMANELTSLKERSPAIILREREREREREKEREIE